MDKLREEKYLNESIAQIVEGDRLAEVFEREKRAIDIDKNPLNLYLIAGLRANRHKNFLNNAMQVTA
jgi:hypothetical protein